MLVERLNRAEGRAEVYDAALDGMADLLGADSASILLFGADDRVHFVAWRGLSESYRAAVDGHSPWRRTDAHATPIAIPDVTASDLDPALRETILAAGHQALSFFPLGRHDQLLGKFMTYYARPRPFRAEEIDLGQVVSIHVAAALGRLLDREELGRREEHFRALIEHSSDFIVLVDDSGRILYESPAAASILGVEPAERLGRSALDRVVPDDRDRTRAAFARVLSDPAYTGPFDVRLRHGGGAVSQFEVRGRNLLAHPAVGAIVLNVRDVTEHRALEEQLRQAQKMEAVGRLAGGVAHDFNNLLTAINGYSELLLRRFSPGDPARREIEEIHRAGRRAAELTGQLLALSRRRPTAPQDVDLNRALADMERLLRRVLGEDLDLVLDLAARPASVRCDAGQLEQVVLNLVLNARDAMPEGGRLEISTRNGRLDEAGARRLSGVEPGAFVELEVRDSGTGMPPEVVEKIFEPFFTTKERGRGTGLGLPTVYAIVRQSGGFLEVESCPGAGSTFRVHLPQVGAGGGTAGSVPAPGAQARHGHERILLVEDDLAVRELLAAALREAGYTVVEAGDGQEALRIAGREPSLALLLTDLVMPRLGGAELARALLAERPALRVVYLSGYSERSESPLPGGGGHPPRFLQKPFPTAELVGAVRETLDLPALPISPEAP